MTNVSSPSPTSSFRRYAESHSGYEGGNISAPIYICGIEYGSRGGNDGIDTWLKAELENDWRTPSCRADDWVDDPAQRLYPFGLWACKFLAVLQGISIGNYVTSSKIKREVMSRYLTRRGDVFQMNLFPIASHDWMSKHHIAQYEALTGFSTTGQYLSWCRENRLPKLGNIVNTHGPKLVLCAGFGHLKDYTRTFAANAVLGECQVTHEDGTLSSRIYTAWTNDGQTLVAVVPFFSSRFGHLSDRHVDLIGRYLLEELRGRFGTNWNQSPDAAPG